MTHNKKLFARLRRQAGHSKKEQKNAMTNNNKLFADADGKLGIPSGRRRQASRISFSSSGTITGG